MEQVVRVKEVHSDGTATVYLQRESACSGDCHKCSGCGAAREIMVFEAQNPIGAQRGDRVIVESGTAPVMKAVAVFYVLPLVLFFLGFFLGDALCGMGILFGILGFAAAVVITVLYDRKIAQKEQVHTITGYARGYVPGTVNKGENELD